MFSKLTTGLVLTVILTSTAFAQTKKAKVKSTTTATAKKSAASADEAKKAEEARIQAAKKAEEDKKALEAKRAEEAKAAASKAEVAPTSTGFLGYMKSHFTASYHGEFYFNRRVDVYNDRVANNVTPNENDKDIQDIQMMHVPTIIYRPFKNWKFLATSEFKYTDVPEKISSADGDPKGNVSTRGTYINRHYRSLFLLTRENILVEKENGIKMDVAVGRRVFDRNHGKAGNYGNTRLNTTLGKKFGDSFTTSTLVQYLHNDPVKEKIKPTQWRHSLELIPSFTWQITEKFSYFFNDDIIINSPWNNDTYGDVSFSHEMNIGVMSYQFNDKNSAYLQIKYLHTEAAPFQKVKGVDDWFEYYIGYTYNITPKISFTPEIGTELFRSSDGRSFFAQKIKYPQLALYVDMSL
ncbi:MAG: hypothetical protein K2Q18_13975 [Bdellovibrionales bacterium]|nr:hypothetical protein [Bdellovibrionales bacterium]